MGLLDMLTGAGNRGYEGGRGMSPIAMAALGLLAYKAVKGFGSQRQAPGSTTPSGTGNFLESLELGGAGSGSVGGVLSGGVSDLMRQFQNAGKGEVADSWVSTGSNKPIPPADLEKVLTPDQIQFLTEKTGLSRDDLLAGLSKQLPEVVDQLTPAGRLPSPQDIERI